MIGILLLCRYSSARLPGKILKTINDKPVLAYILERLEPVKGQCKIVVCTSTDPSDDILQAYCISNGISCFRGSLDKVSERFLHCAKHYKFKIAVRINGDNIFTDPELILRVLEKMKDGKNDFVSNVKGRTFPSGISVEAIRTDLYEKEYPNFTAYDKEHVMTYFYEFPGIKSYFLLNKNPVGNELNLSIDTPEDFTRTERIIQSMDRPHTTYGYEDIVGLYQNL